MINLIPDQGRLTARCDCGQVQEYHKLETAAKMVGLYPESLRRAYRYKLGEHGTKLPVGLYFTAEDLGKLGYPLEQEVVNV
jgi:hypothetical protein